MDIYSLAAVENKIGNFFFMSYTEHSEYFLSLNLLWQGPQREREKDGRDLEVEGRNSERRWGGRERERERERERGERDDRERDEIEMRREKR